MPRNIIDLFSELEKIEKIENKISFNDNAIIIKIHNELNITIKDKGLFHMFLNDIFYYDIEPQDVVAFIDEIVNGMWLFIEYKTIFGKIKIKLINKKNYKKLLTKKIKRQIKIFTIE